LAWKLKGLGWKATWNLFSRKGNENMDLSNVRSCFPGTRDRVFLDAACISLMPVQAETALHGLAADLGSCPVRDASSHHVALDRTARQPRSEIARLIGCRHQDVALVESTTQGLQILAAAIPLRRGDRILVGEIEFLGLAVPWIPRRETDGIVIDTVPHRQGRLLVDDFARAIDGRTRLILLSSVQWNNGFRADLAAFAELAEKHGIPLVVDVIQQLGGFVLDVGRTPVDFVVCGGHKWLNAPAGRGFLYIHPRQIERLRPPAWGYLNIATPPEGWAEYFGTPTIPAVRPYDFIPGARSFEVGGTGNYPGNVVLGASVALINEVGRDAIEAHILGLTEQLIEGLNRLGATVVSLPEPSCRSGIISFTLGQGLERDRALMHTLWDQKIVISQRYTAGVGGLRVSVHFYNNREDIEQLLAAVKRR
jgi:cysteine desulfurase / selenocysteine lyase